MEHFHRSAGGSNCFPLRDSYPADRPGRHQQSQTGSEFLREFKASFSLGLVVAGVLEADRESIDAGIFYACNSNRPRWRFSARVW